MGLNMGWDLTREEAELRKKHLEPSGAAINSRRIHYLTFWGLEFLSSETLKYILKLYRLSFNPLMFEFETVNKNEKQTKV